MAGSIPLPKSGDTEIWIANFNQNPQVDNFIDRLENEFPEDYTNLN